MGNNSVSTVQLADVLAARNRIHQLVHKTPLEYSTTFSQMIGGNAYLKLECFQKTGSFKIRGAANKLANLSQEERRAGVIAASAGNHAQGVALAASLNRIPATIVMPENAPLTKVSATEAYGAKVVLHGNVYDEAYAKAMELQAESGATFVHAFDDLDIIAGQGTIALEILEQLPDVDDIIIPVGGGGLLAGVATVIKSIRPQTRIIGVEASGAASMKAALTSGKPVMLNEANTLADGIAVKRVGDLPFKSIEHYVDEMITVQEEEISAAILILLERSKAIAEGAGAVTLAAAIGDKLKLTNRTACFIISGGNIDVNFLSQIIERGLRRTKRTMTFRTVLPDIPGKLEQLIKLIADERANIVTVEQSRYDLSVPLRYAKVIMTIETQNEAHQQRIQTRLKDAGYEYELANC